MGYFSNGTEGMLYEEGWCDRCVHRDADGSGCPVWNAHLLYNYQECNNKDSILHLLIPRENNGLSNGRCLMFHEKSAVRDLFAPSQEADRG